MRVGLVLRTTTNIHEINKSLLPVYAKATFGEQKWAKYWPTGVVPIPECRTSLSRPILLPHAQQRCCLRRQHLVYKTLASDRAVTGDLVDVHVLPDVQSVNIGIHLAWRQASDGTLWRRIVDTAALHHGTPRRKRGLRSVHSLRTELNCCSRHIVSNGSVHSARADLV